MFLFLRRWPASAGVAPEEHPAVVDFFLRSDAARRTASDELSESSRLETMAMQGDSMRRVLLVKILLFICTQTFLGKNGKIR